MIGNLNAGELVLLALVGIFIFGPERLPRVISDAAAMLRQLRDLARNATAELRSEIGDDLDLGLPVEDLQELRSLNPRAFARSLLEDSPAPAASSGSGAAAGGASSSPAPPAPVAAASAASASAASASAAAARADAGGTGEPPGAASSGPAGTGDEPPQAVASAARSLPARFDPDAT